jgi:hypothetical protein
VPEKMLPPEDPPQSHSFAQSTMATEIHTIPATNDQLSPDENVEVTPDEDTETSRETTSVQLSENRIHYLLRKARTLLFVNSLDEAHQIAKVVLKSNPDHEEAPAIENDIKQCAFEVDDKFPGNASETRERMIKSVKDTWELSKIPNSKKWTISETYTLKKFVMPIRKVKAGLRTNGKRLHREHVP